jgi:hypothetical protein
VWISAARAGEKARKGAARGKQQGAARRPDETGRTGDLTDPDHCTALTGPELTNGTLMRTGIGIEKADVRDRQMDRQLDRQEYIG